LASSTVYLEVGAVIFIPHKMTRNNVSRVLPLLLAIPATVTATCTAEFFESLVQVNPNATVNYASPVEEGGSFGPASLAYPTPATDLPTLCAVSVNIKSSANTSYNFGLFLPDTWNERFLATGNGAFNGGINW
jgi:feruloyl esterase